MAGNGPAPSGRYSVAARSIVFSPKSPLMFSGTVTPVPTGCARHGPTTSNSTRTATRGRLKPRSSRWAAIRDSLDDLICPLQERGRDRESERLHGLHVYHQLELRRLLDGKIRGLGALEDFVDVGRGAAK